MSFYPPLLRSGDPIKKFNGWIRRMFFGKSQRDIKADKLQENNEVLAQYTHYRPVRIIDLKLKSFIKSQDQEGFKDQMFL